jgi:murein DD-endopeptidase MepM/ murein hydrolase activator NlpD
MDKTLRKIIRLYLLLFVFVSFYGSCSSVKGLKKHSQFYFNPNYEVIGDSIRIILKNPVKCPLRFFITSSDVKLKAYLLNKIPIVANALEEITVSIPIIDNYENTIKSLKLNAKLGNPSEVKIVKEFKYALPFKANKTYKILQHHNGKLSHNSDYSRYAIDFKMNIGDTICAARDGIVVGVVSQNNVSGKNKKYRDFANYITLYHNDDTFTQYVHLSYNGVFVKLGDTVKQKDPIGLLGNTGFSTTPHLHFNSLKPIKGGIISFPVQFLKK